MKKRILAVLMMMVMVLATAMSVSAAPSPTESIVESGASTGKYDITADAKNGVSEYKELAEAEVEATVKEVYADTNLSDAEIAEKVKEAKESVAEAKVIIEKINKGDAVATIKEMKEDVKKDIADKKLVHKFFDLDEKGDHSKCHAQGYHEVTLYVAGLSKDWKDITLLHYSATRFVWETIQDKDILKVDYDKHEITFKIKDLSPLAIYANVVEDNKAGTSDQTEGVSSAWMLYSAMALIVLGAGVIVSQKKRG